MSSQLNSQPRDIPETEKAVAQESSTPLISHIHGMIHAASHSFSVSRPVVTKNTWIIDFGATNHVCCTHTSFSDLHPITTIAVTLPNGLSVTVTQAGTVKLSSSLTLHGVLYIPSFSFNLISVSCLTSSLSCSVKFLSNSFLIQD